MFSRGSLWAARGIAAFAGVVGAVVLSTLLLGGLAVVQAARPRAEAPPPLLIPPEAGYTDHMAADPALAADKRPVAQLLELPTDVNPVVQGNFPDILPWEDANVEAYAVLSGLRYTIGQHTVLVTTARMSPGAVQSAGQPGETSIQLGTRGNGWHSTNMEGAFPNRVFFVQDDLLVTVASDLPIARLQQLAERVAVKNGQ